MNGKNSTPSCPTYSVKSVSLFTPAHDGELWSTAWDVAAIGPEGGDDAKVYLFSIKKGRSYTARVERRFTAGAAPVT